jgi:hypothetical protein
MPVKWLISSLKEIQALAQTPMQRPHPLQYSGISEGFERSFVCAIGAPQKIRVKVTI